MIAESGIKHQIT